MMMRNIALLFVLLVSCLARAVAQESPTLAKAEYQLAEKAFSSADYPAALTHLRASVKQGGRENQLTLYLKVMTLNELSDMHSFFIDSLRMGLAQFHANPNAAKLGGSRAAEIAAIDAALPAKEDNARVKSAAYNQVLTFCDNAFAVGTEMSTLEAAFGTKKMKLLLKEKIPTTLQLMEFDVDKMRSDAFTSIVPGPFTLLTGKDIGTTTGASCKGSSLFGNVEMNFMGILLDKRNRVVCHIYTAAARDKSDVKDALLKDLGTPLVTGYQGVFRLWLYGKSCIFYSMDDGDHRVLLYNNAYFH